MCNQAVSLVAAELERRGIATVAIQLLKKVAEKVRPPGPCGCRSLTAILWIGHTIRPARGR